MTTPQFAIEDLSVWIEQSVDALQVWHSHSNKTAPTLREDVVFERILASAICMGVPGVEFVSIAATPIAGVSKLHSLFAYKIGDVVVHRNERLTLQELERRTVEIHRASYQATGREIDNLTVETTILRGSQLLEKPEFTGCGWTAFLAREIGSRHQSHVQANELHYAASTARPGAPRRI